MAATNTIQWHGCVVRATAELSSAVVAQLDEGSDITVAERVVLPSGRERCRLTSPVEGWVSAMFLSPSAVPGPGVADDAFDEDDDDDDPLLGTFDDVGPPISPGAEDDSLAVERHATAVFSAGPVPDGAARAIARLAGNDRCFDCGLALIVSAPNEIIEAEASDEAALSSSSVPRSADGEPAFADVRRGVLTCAACAERAIMAASSSCARRRRRRRPPDDTFDEQDEPPSADEAVPEAMLRYRSLELDAFSEDQRTALLLGGNAQLRHFLERHADENVASMERAYVAALDAEVRGGFALPDAPPAHLVDANRPTSGRCVDGRLRRVAIDPTCERRVRVDFPFSVVRCHGDRCAVTTSADPARLRPGDLIVGVERRRAWRFDQVVALARAAGTDRSLVVRRVPVVAHPDWGSVDDDAHTPLDHDDDPASFSENEDDDGFHVVAAGSASEEEAAVEPSSHAPHASVVGYWGDEGLGDAAGDADAGVPPTTTTTTTTEAAPAERRRGPPAGRLGPREPPELLAFAAASSTEDKLAASDAVWK